MLRNIRQTLSHPSPDRSALLLRANECTTQRMSRPRPRKTTNFPAWKSGSVNAYLEEQEAQGYKPICEDLALACSPSVSMYLERVNDSEKPTRLKNPNRPQKYVRTVIAPFPSVSICAPRGEYASCLSVQRQEGLFLNTILRMLRMFGEKPFIWAHVRL